MTFSVISIDDEAFSQDSETGVGKYIIEFFRDKGFDLDEHCLIPREEGMISDYLMRFCDKNCSDLLITHGGAGLSQGDVVPEVTRKAIDKDLFGLGDLIRMEGSKKNSDLLLFRGISGIRNSSLIINMPADIEEVKTCLDIIYGPSIRCIDLLNNPDKY